MKLRWMQVGLALLGLLLVASVSAEASNYFEDFEDYAVDDDYPNIPWATWNGTNPDMINSVKANPLFDNPFRGNNSMRLHHNGPPGVESIGLNLDTPDQYTHISMWISLVGTADGSDYLQVNLVDRGTIFATFFAQGGEVFQPYTGAPDIDVSCYGINRWFVIVDIDWGSDEYDLTLHGIDGQQCGQTLNRAFVTGADELTSFRFDVSDPGSNDVQPSLDDVAVRTDDFPAVNAVPGFYFQIDSFSGTESNFTIDFPFSTSDAALSGLPDLNYGIEYDAGTGYTFLGVYPATDDTIFSDARVTASYSINELGGVNWRIFVFGHDGPVYSCVITASMASTNSYECGDPVGGGGPGSPAAPTGISGIVVSPADPPAEGVINFRWPLSSDDPDQDVGLFQYELLRDSISMCVDTLTAEDGGGFRTAQCSPGTVVGSHSFTVRATNTTSGLTSAVSCNILLTTDTLGSAATCGGVAYPDGVSAGGGSEPITLPGLDPEVLGTDLGISTAAAGWFLGLLLIGGLAGGLATIPGFGLGGGILGFILGTGVSVAFGLIPLWFPFLLVIVGGAALVMFMGSGGG